MNNLIANLLTIFILNKGIRKSLKNRILTRLNAHKLIRRAKYIGQEFTCFNKSYGNHNTSIGNNVVFNQVSIIGDGECEIGNFCQFGHEVLIITSNHNYDKGEFIPYSKENIYKKVQISDFVWCGSRVTILPGTTIGKGVVIQAGSVVHGNIPDFAVVGGNPAKVFKYRDIEHFKKLEQENKFLTINEDLNR